MKLWLVTTIRLREGASLPAPALQNLRTAEALARAGHQILVWFSLARGEAAPDPAARFEAEFGRRPPEGLLFLPYAPHGARDDKKTPFARKWDRWRNPRRAAELLGGAPDAVISRSPLALAQLRAAGAGSASWQGVRRVLEWQYPEHMQLWRGWRKRRPDAPLRECVRRLREWRGRELDQVHAADGVLYAARDHLRLLRAARYQGPRAPLHSACEHEAAVVPPAPPDYDFGYVGALAPENGVETLLDALKRLDAGRLLVVGEGAAEHSEGLKARAGALGIASRVDFAGGVLAREVEALMRRCAVGVVPIERRAGPEKRQFASPLKLIEWMGAGVPVVAGDAPSIAWRVEDGAAARLFRAGDARALAEALAALRGDASLRAQLAAAGLAHAAEHSFDHRAARIAAFIAELG